MKKTSELHNHPTPNQSPDKKKASKKNKTDLVEPVEENIWEDGWKDWNTK
jgi:hypothetical protein